jgi:hypothetical protein
LTDAIVEPHDIFGEGVNLAARLQSSAEPGGIVVSAVVAEELRVRGPTELVDLGVLTLKHLSRPVRAFALRTGANVPSAALLPPQLPDDRPSIAVLPFRVQPGDNQDTWFAEGIIEGIIHVLSGIENLFVIGAARAQLMPDGHRSACGWTRPRVRYVLGGVSDARMPAADHHGAGRRLDEGNVIQSDRHGGHRRLFDSGIDRARSCRRLRPPMRDRGLARALRMHPTT